MKRLRIVCATGFAHRTKIYDGDGNDISQYFSGFEIKGDCRNEPVTVSLESPCVEFEIEATPEGPETIATLSLIGKHFLKKNENTT